MSKKENIYLDYHATTPVDPKVLQKMLPYFCDVFGNPASQHPWGWDATAAVDDARNTLSEAIGAKEKEIVFTGGATEATNIALFGLFELFKEQKKHIITTNTEHKSVLSVCEELEKRGAELSILPADREGRVSPEQVKNAIRDNTLFVSCIFANNEIGAINPIGEIGKVCKSSGVYFHTDAVQAIGKLPVNVESMGIDLMSLTAHKIYGPKGTGALYIRGQNPKVKLKPFLLGGGHENGRRSGTLNVAGIVGLAEAIRLTQEHSKEEYPKMFEQRDILRKRILQICDEKKVKCHINGPKNLDHILPNNLSLSFEDIDASSLKTALRNVAYSTGSACSTASATPSHVLKAIGLSDELAKNTMRLSVGRFTTWDELEAFAEYFSQAIEKAKTSQLGGISL